MLFREITLTNVLSFRKTRLELGPLNVLIGANAAGKSNLIEAISLLQAAPGDLQAALLRGGGVRTWIWLGGSVPSPIASLECRLTESLGSGLRYFLEFSEEAWGGLILRERLESEEGQRVFFERNHQELKLEDATASIPASHSVLSRAKSPVDKTPITRTGREFENIRIYRELRTGPLAPSRYGISATAAKEFLSETGDNLALVLLDLDFRGALGNVVNYLRRLCDRFEDVKIRLDSGIAQTYVRETGILEPLPAARLSDGTLRFLCLMAVLLHPAPPSLICLEEPEIGLHPEAVQIVAQALIEASERTQLIVTTQSDALVDALSATPESVLVCERDSDDGTQFRRLSKAELEEWLERYSLGELWKRGEIGGTRW